jgi:pilus biogenesis lipoprotein CpaD
MNNKTSAMDIALLLFALVAMVGLTGCEMHHETYMTPNKMEVHETQFNAQASVSEMNEYYLVAVAQEYDKNGNGPVDLTVTYDPKSRTNTAMRASANASRIGSVLRGNGVPEVNASILPVHASGGVSNALLSYSGYEVTPPKDCSMIDGLEYNSVEANPDYKLGCSMNTVMAKQVARPKDLAGTKVDEPTTDGRRNANIIERYRVGEPNEKLEGEGASDD